MIEELHSPFVSVIIPVFNDAKRLKICLEALEQQTYPRTLYEVIVIDNGSDNDENIEEIIAQFNQAFATSENIPGSYAARNKGIFLAQGDVIAFTDADCIPARNWIQKGVINLMQMPNCGLVVGKVEIFLKEPNKRTLVELYESITAFRQKELLEKYRGGVTANLFTFKAVIERVGSFNENLKSSGDIEWGQRVYSFGYQQVYADDTCVVHPARSSFTQLYRKTRRVAGGVYDLYIQESASLVQREKTFFRLILNDFFINFQLILNLFFKFKIRALNQMIGLMFIIIFVGFVSVFEKLRLKLGGISTRN